MPIDFAAIRDRLTARVPQGGNVGVELVWVLTEDYHVSRMDPRYKPPDGWCEITPAQARSYLRALNGGDSLALALHRSNLPPVGPHCPAGLPVPTAVIEPGAPAAPRPSPAFARRAPTEEGRRTAAERPRRPPKPPRTPRPPREPRNARPARPPRPPRAKRAPRRPRPARPPRDKRAPRDPRKRVNTKQQRFICTFKRLKNGQLMYGWHDLDTPAARKRAADGGLSIIEAANPASCMEESCTGPLAGVLRTLLGFLPDSWKITQQDVLAAAEARATARTAARVTLRPTPTGTGAQITATPALEGPAPGQLLMVYVARSGVPLQTWGRQRLAALYPIDPSTVYGGTGAEYANIGTYPPTTYDVWIH